MPEEIDPAPWNDDTIAAVAVVPCKKITTSEVNGVRDDFESDVILLDGVTYPVKETLKEMGFVWTTDFNGIDGAVSATRPPQPQPPQAAPTHSRHTPPDSSRPPPQALTRASARYAAEPLGGAGRDGGGQQGRQALRRPRLERHHLRRRRRRRRRRLNLPPHHLHPPLLGLPRDAATRSRMPRHYSAYL